MTIFTLQWTSCLAWLSAASLLYGAGLRGRLRRRPLLVSLRWAWAFAALVLAGVAGRCLARLAADGIGLDPETWTLSAWLLAGAVALVSVLVAVAWPATRGWLVLGARFADLRARLQLALPGVAMVTGAAASRAGGTADRGTVELHLTADGICGVRLRPAGSELAAHVREVLGEVVLADGIAPNPRLWRLLVRLGLALKAIALIVLAVDVLR